MEVPFALSIHTFVNSVGADVGFAAFVAVAIMALLYFAQARETATLRERLEEAHERIGGLEVRVAQLMHAQATRQTLGVPAGRAVGPVPIAPPPVAPPPVARPMGSALASVRRVASATPAASLAGAAVARQLLPGAPYGVGAPALASATKLIPNPVAGAAATGEPSPTPPTATGAGNGQAPRPAVKAPPPLVQIRTDRAATHTQKRHPGDSADGGVPTELPGARQQFRLLAEEHSMNASVRSRLAGRVLPAGIALLAVIVIGVGLYVITAKTGGVATPPVSHAGGTMGNGVGGSTAHRHHHGAGTRFSPATVSVAVLNGTNVGGLAADVGKALRTDGYHKGSITNAATQTQARTTVYYRPGYRTAASHVAGALQLHHARLAPASASVLQACETTPAGAASTCGGNVIVSAGRDLAGMAAGRSASAP